MIKREANATIQWNNYLRKDRTIFGAFELKQTQTEKLYFSSFEPQQIDSLMAIEEGGLTWKISDADPRLKPCDVIVLPPSPAYVVIKYPDCFTMIRVTDFVNFMNNTQNSYISYKEAKEISTKNIVI